MYLPVQGCNVFPDKTQLGSLLAIETQVTGLSTASFVIAGRLLKPVKDQTLFKCRGFATFRDYIDANRGVYHFSGKTAERCIVAAEVIDDLVAGEPKPNHLMVALQLSCLRGDKDVMNRCWLHALTLSEGGHVTVKVIKQAVADVMAGCSLSGGDRQPGKQTSTHNNWFTPTELVDSVLQVFHGVIDLDPCSCDEAQGFIQAKHYYTAHDVEAGCGLYGLGRPWHGNVYVNPPYGKHGRVSIQGMYLRKAINAWKSGEVHAVILLLKAAVGSAWFSEVYHFPHCWMVSRVQYLQHCQGPQPDSRPCFGSVVVYMGPHVSDFCKVFSRFGVIPGRSGWAAPQKGQRQLLLPEGI